MISNTFFFFIYAKRKTELKKKYINTNVELYSSNIKFPLFKKPKINIINDTKRKKYWYLLVLIFDLFISSWIQISFLPLSTTFCVWTVRD